MARAEAAPASQSSRDEDRTRVFPVALTFWSCRQTTGASTGAKTGSWTVHDSELGGRVVASCASKVQPVEVTVRVRWPVQPMARQWGSDGVQRPQSETV